MKTGLLWLRACVPLLLPVLAAGAGTITVTPNNESVVVNGTRQMTATVSGLMDNSVSWSVNGGTINTSGLFTAPPAAPSPAYVTVTATSMADPTVSGSAVLNIRSVAPVITSVTPSSFPLGAFSLVVNGSGFQPGVSAWLGSSAIGAAYVNPAQIKVSGNATQSGNNLLRVMNPGSMIVTYTVVVTSSSGGGGGSATLTIQPSNPSVPQGKTQQFSALLYGYPQTATWSVGGVTGGNSIVGTISATGLYTAPTAIPSPATVTIQATNSSGTGTGSVTVVTNQPPTITGVNPSPIPLGVYTISITGAGFIGGSSQAALGGTNLATTYISPTQLTATGVASISASSTVTVSNTGIPSLPFPVQVGVAQPLVSYGAAARFLEQTTFGPNPADVMNLQQLGFQGWLNQQFAMAPVSNFQNIAGSQGGMSQRFMTNAVMNSDQLRQRVGFMMSQILVTSINKLIWTPNVVPYQEMLLNDSFGNYRQILNDVTLSPAMGYFLDMANNGKGNATGTVLPNENYAREILQLFSIGTLMLNPDGTPQLDAQGNPIPAYSQKTITEFARVFTGWTNAPTTPGAPVVWNAYMNPNAPLVSYAPQHDTGTKTLLANSVKQNLNAGQSAPQDLADALDNIFYHPNAGPFISKQLIQHLVKSNPSPGYVSRVAAVFNDNGQNVRGDMKAVLTAILLDVEARQGDSPGNELPTDGHLQEPALFLPGVLRAFNAQVNDQNYFSWDLINMAEDVYNAPSVFNFYAPGYQVPSFNLTGGEFAIYTPYTALYRANWVSTTFSSYSSLIQTSGPGLTVDLTAWASLAGNPAALTDALDLALTRGQIPQALKQIITTAITNELGGNLRRVQTGIFLLATSGYYNVWH